MLQNFLIYVLFFLTWIISNLAVLEFTLKLMETGVKNDAILALIVFFLQYVLIKHEYWKYKLKHTQWRVTLKVKPFVFSCARTVTQVLCLFWTLDKLSLMKTDCVMVLCTDLVLINVIGFPYCYIVYTTTNRIGWYILCLAFYAYLIQVKRALCLESRFLFYTVPGAWSVENVYYINFMLRKAGWSHSR